MIKKPKIEFLKEYNSFFILPTIRIVSERDSWNSPIYLSVDMSWFNQSVSFVFVEEEKYL